MTAEKRSWKDFAILIALMTVFFAGAVKVVPVGAYGYDESDYVFVASARGWFAHWLDSPAQSLPSFIITGLGRGKDPAQRAALSEQVRASGDVNFYRHWHGPLSFYWLKLALALGEERAVRISFFVFPVAAAFLIYFVVLGWRGRWAAFWAASVFLLSFPNAESAGAVAPHAAYFCCYAGALLSLARFVDSGKKSWWVAAIVFTGLAFAALEVALILILTLGLTCWIERKRLFAGWSFKQWRNWTLSSLAWFSATLVVVWPAALFKLSFLKAWVFMAYLSLFRKAPWGSDSVAASWLKRWSDNPLEWGFVTAGLVYYLAVARKREQGRALLPLVIYALLMMLAVGRVASDESRYFSPFFAALQLLAALTFAATAPRIAGFVMIPVLALNFLWLCHQRQARPDPPSLPLVAFLRQLPSLPGEPLWIPAGELPRIHCYFPEMRTRPYADQQELLTGWKGSRALAYAEGQVSWPDGVEAAAIVRDRLAGTWYLLQRKNTGQQ